MKRTYTKVNGLGERSEVKLTKAEATRLARQARQYGHLNAGREEGARVGTVFCPLCRERVKGYWSPNGLAGPRTAAQGLDRGVIEHLTEDCPEVIRTA